jgi:hypothetical protein
LLDTPSLPVLPSPLLCKLAIDMEGDLGGDTG